MQEFLLRYVSTNNIIVGICHQGTFSIPKRNKNRSYWLIETLINSIVRRIVHSISLEPLALVQ
jgi:hypothetical protein